MKLSDSVLKRRVFNKGIYDLHRKDFMLGQTTPYLSKLKNTIDVGAATGMYASHFAEHSKSVICFEAVPPVYEQLILIKEKYNIISYKISDYWLDIGKHQDFNKAKNDIDKINFN